MICSFSIGPAAVVCNDEAPGIELLLSFEPIGPMLNICDLIILLTFYFEIPTISDELQTITERFGGTGFRC